MLSGLVTSTVFKKNLWAFLGPCVRGRGRPWYGTSAQPESHFACSSPKGSPWVVPSTSLRVSSELFLGILRGPGEGRGGAPGTVSLQNPEVTSRNACLRNADLSSRGNKRALFKRALCSLPDVWPLPPHASLPCLLSPPPLLSIASTLSELKWAIASPKKGQAMQRCHQEQSARSKGACLSHLELLPYFPRILGFGRKNESLPFGGNVFASTNKARKGRTGTRARPF